MRRIMLTAIFIFVISTPRVVLAQSISSELAPKGKLRVAASGTTPVLLRRTADGTIIGGVAIDVGKFIAEKLGGLL